VRGRATALADRLGRLRLHGYALLLAATALTLLVAIVPGLPGAHPAGLFVVLLVGALLLLGLGAGAVLQAWGGRDAPGH